MAVNNQNVSDTEALVKKLSAIGWGVFFIWIGIAFATNLGWGVGILGVGVIALVGEAARICFGLPLDWFWLMTGIIFAVWGICELLKVQFGGSLVPILCIVLGVAILTTAFRPKPRH